MISTKKRIATVLAIPFKPIANYWCRGTELTFLVHIGTPKLLVYFEITSI